MRMRFRRLKDVTAGPMHLLMRATGAVPGLQRAAFAAMGVMAKAYWYAPGSHGRRTGRAFCRLTGRPDAQRLCYVL